jgi:hypothetical protein
MDLVESGKGDNEVFNFSIYVTVNLTRFYHGISTHSRRVLTCARERAFRPFLVGVQQSGTSRFVGM